MYMGGSYIHIDGPIYMYIVPSTYIWVKSSDQLRVEQGRKYMKFILLFAILTIPLLAFSAEKPADFNRKIIDHVQQKYPEVKWDKKSIKKADINCDGKQDFALLGKEGGNVMVAVIVGPLSEGSKILISQLRVGKQSQDSLCVPRARLTLEDQDYDASEIYDGQSIPGFRRSMTCKGINVADGECDSFHYFWNHDLKTLQWWRL